MTRQIDMPFFYSYGFIYKGINRLLTMNRTTNMLELENNASSSKTQNECLTLIVLEDLKNPYMPQSQAKRCLYTHGWELRG